MAGIYIHIPFCKQKCTYCDFHFSTTFQSYRKEMLAVIRKELIDRASYLKEQLIETIYFGGGTPSLLEEDEIMAILETIAAHYVLDVDREISLEANPDDMTKSKLEAWKKLGINRLSVGLQSFRKEDLEWMNRAHTATESLQCIALAQEVGYDNISVDLIYGLPDLSLAEWQQNLQTVLDFNVQHVSAYCLTVEEKTVLHNWVKNKTIKPADEDAQSDQFELLVQMLAENGIYQYEISNFSKTGFHSRHNSNYWKGKHYLGVGPSAHSFNGTSRSWNIANNRTYIKLITENQPYSETEWLSSKDRFNEMLLIGLRTIYGVDLEQLCLIQEPSSKFQDTLKEMIANNWVEQSAQKIYLTSAGRLKTDYIASELFL